VKFLTLFTLFVCVSGAFGQPNASFYVSTSGFDSIAAPKLSLGARFNTSQTRHVRAGLSMCAEESTKT
jgi:hypothetical protein